MSPPLVIATGMKREAALLSGPDRVIVIGGGDASALRQTLQAAIASHRPSAVLSVGIGGALSPALRIGDWVAADAVVSGAQRWPTSTGWVDALSARLRSLAQHVERGGVAAGDTIVVDAAAKAALHAATDALAVDMESHVAAEVAAEQGLPFAALRVISDAAGHDLPKAVQVAMKKDGGVDIPAVLRELVKDPRQFPALIRTGREAEVAFRGLGLLRGHDLLAGLGVGDADLGQLAVDVV